MANLPPGQGSGAVSGETGVKQAGAALGGDPSNEPGQYPGSLFGVGLPQGTGAPGSSGAPGGSDPTAEPGQLTEGISGLGPADTADTGAPGTMGQENAGGGGDRVTYTRPGAYLTGTNVQDTVNESISGTGDWTQAIDGSYAGGGPQLPGIKGNEPTSAGGPYQPGSGRVLRGGRGAR
jgi:hypothetical protein